MYCVYKHTGPTGKIYIGITKRKPEKRWNHGNGYESNVYFYRAIQKFGWENFKHEIVADGLDRDEACEMERRLIAEYDSTNPEKGYNIEAGGIDGAAIFTESMRKSFSERGKRVTTERPELIEIMQNAQREYFADPNNRQKHSDTIKRYYENHPEARERISKENQLRWTDDFRQKFGELQRAVKSTPEARKKARDTHKAQMRAIEQLTLDGDLIAVYECIGDATRATGIGRQNICSVLKKRPTKAGNERQTAGGFKWRYVDEGK